MHRCSIALLLALTISSPAQAQLWDYVVTSEFGNVYYIDPLSIKRTESIVSYTQLTNYSKNKEIFDYEDIFFVENSIEGFIEEVLPDGSFKKSCWL